MASESSEERTVSVGLPSALDEWLEAKATELGVDRETVVVQLLSSYRAAAELGDDLSGPFGDVEAVESRLDADVGRVEREFDEKIRDVRERVVQVKREADAKAPADHSHSELGDIETLSSELSDLRARLGDIEGRLDDGDRDGLDERLAHLEGAADRLDEVERRLRTVAWVVSDLEDAVDGQAGGRGVDSQTGDREADSRTSDQGIDQLKRSAAEADVARAVCDSCEKPVDIALLTEPRCPHCDAAVGDVDRSGGLFGKPRLTVAKRLESGEDGDEDSNVPDAARRG